MSAYPPPPPFGGPFNPHPRYPPSSGGGNAVMPHFQYQQVQDPNLQRHGQPGIPATQFANAYSYSSNGQASNSSLPSNGAPNPFFPGYSLTPSNSFPPPPFPPVPISSCGTFPQPALSLHTPRASTGPAQPPTTLPPKPPLPLIPVRPFDSGLQTPTNAAAAASDLEDGELSDGESSRHTKETKAGYKISPHPPARKTNEERQQPRRNKSSHANGRYHSPNGNVSRYSPRNQVKPRHFSQTAGHFPSNVSPGPTIPSVIPSVNGRGQGQDIYDHRIGINIMTSNGPSSGARYLPIAPSENQQQSTTQEVNFQHSLSSKPQARSEIKNNATMPTSDRAPSTNGYSLHDTKIARHLRDRAKVALQELHPYNIGYSKIVHEGLDSSLLLELYNEMGIKVSSPALTRQPLDSAESQGSASITPKVSITGDGPSRPDSPHLKPTSPNAITTVSYANHNAGAQRPVVPADRETIIKQKGPKQGSQGRASGQILQGSQTSADRLIISKSKAVDSRDPSLPEKINHPNEVQSNNAKIATVIASTTNAKVDTTSASGPTKPLPKSLPSNPVAAKPADKALERKDYIARMLAAKAGKPMPTSNALTPSINYVTRETKTTTQPPPPVDLQTASTPDQCRLYIGNLAYSTSEDDLKAIFGDYSIVEVLIPINPNTASSVGYGFVQLSTSSESQRAMSELSGKIVGNRKISVQMTKEAKPALKNVEAAAQAGILSTDEDSQDNLAVQSTSTEAKRKAQTDLARQKMEALKSRTVSQRQTSISNSLAPPIIQPHPLPQIPPSSVLHVNSASQAQASNPTQTTPHGSYFSPSNERQAFSIPGLFMAPARPSCTVEKEQPIIHPLTAHQGNAQVTTSILSSDTMVYAQALPSQSTAVDASNNKRNLVLTAEALEKPASSASRVNEPRKRQRASDFIDSPPMRPKRTLGQKEDISVIIDVSEDEVDDSETEADAMDIEQDTNINSNLRQLQHEGMETGKQRAIRDLPPLTDFPARKKLSDSSAFNTPPAVQTPGKLKEQEGLKTKEKEIELMKRRIAELEQRTKAKQTSSRAQTPGTPGHATSPQRPIETRVEENEQLSSSVMLAEPIREQLQADALTLPAPKTTRDIIGEEERAIEVENQIGRFPAAPETLQTVKRVISEEDQQEQPPSAHLKELEPIRTNIDQSQVAQITTIEERQQSQLCQPHTKETTQSPAQTNRLPAPELVDMEREQQRLIPEQRVENLAHSNTDPERSRSVEAETSEEQGRRRRAEIKFGLPILDAEVERTKQRLQELRKQMEDLESEVQKGLKGRRSLVEELVSLSPASSPTLKASSYKRQESADKPGNKPQTEKIPDSQAFVVVIPQIMQPIAGTTTTNNPVELPAARTQPPSSPLISPVSQTGDAALAEDVMDISSSSSSSDVNEGEITEYSPEPPNTVEDPILIPESEDTYEPPLTIDSVPFCTLAAQQGGPIARATVSVSSLVGPNDLQEGLEKLVNLQASGGSSEVTNESGEISTASCSQSLADDSDPDDYEPPEPAIPVEASTLPSNHNTIPPEPYFSPRDPNAPSVPRSPSSGVIPGDHNQVDNIALKPAEIEFSRVVPHVSKSKMTRFTPYESPLKQFKSYRYHPNYATEVSEGFRSLTYSHKINPDKPICRYEAAGGRCNDDSCDSQHFRSLGLSDDMVLVHMGTTPAGFSAQETDAYVGGLRQIIQEIRGRKVKDFDKVAAEISAYRRRFLNDDSKVLPLGL